MLTKMIILDQIRFKEKVTGNYGLATGKIKARRDQPKARPLSSKDIDC